MDIDTTIRGILSSTRTVAVVGFSDNPKRESNEVAQFLAGCGYRVFGVNPNLAGRTVDGIRVYQAVSNIPGLVDMVDIFRRSEFLEEEIRRTIALKDDKAIKAVWLQLELTHPEAEAFARKHGVKVVSNRCPKIEIEKRKD